MIGMLPLMEAVQCRCQAALPSPLLSLCACRHPERCGGELIRDKSSSASPALPAQINEEYTNRPEGYLEGEEAHSLIQTDLNPMLARRCPFEQSFTSVDTFMALLLERPCRCSIQTMFAHLV